jgi:ribonuclease P protein component
VLKAESDLQFVPRRSFAQQEAALFFQHARRVARYPAFDILLAQCRDVSPKLLVVTSRHLANASERNRIRRRIKAIFHECQPLSPAYDCALIIKKPALLLSYVQLMELIISSLANYTNSL